MPYSLNGRWFPQAWFDEMGMPVPHQESLEFAHRRPGRSFEDPTDEEISAGWAEFYAQEEERRGQEAEAERLRIEEEHRLAALAAIAAAEAEERQRAARAGAMDRIREQFQDTLFTVTEEQVYRLFMHDLFVEGPRAEYVQVPGHKAIINSSTNQTLSIKSTEYEIIQDVDVLARYMAIFEAADVAVEPVRHHVTRSKDGVIGRSTYMELNLPDSALNFSPGNQAMMADCRVILTNSNDGSLKNRFYKAYINRQSRMMTIGWSQNMAFGVRHRTGASERMVNVLRAYLTSSAASEMAVYARLNDRHGNPDSIAAYLENNPLLPGERNAAKMMGAWMRAGNPTSMWNIYSLFAQFISTEYGRNFGSKLTKLEGLNREVKTNWARVITIVNSTDRYLLEGITLGTEQEDN